MYIIEIDEHIEFEKGKPSLVIVIILFDLKNVTKHGRQKIKTERGYVNQTEYGELQKFTVSKYNCIINKVDTSYPQWGYRILIRKETSPVYERH